MATSKSNIETSAKLLDTPILFVPGALTGDWVWERNFESYFELQGFPTHTMSFSSHGSPLFKRNTIRFSDYLDECIAKIESLDQAPILVAHSLGGLIALHAATKVPVHSMVLLSPVPHSGVIGSLSKLGIKSPLSLLKFASVMLDTRLTKYGSPPVGIFSDTCDEELIENVTSQLKPESMRVMLKLLAPPRLDKEKLQSDRVFFVAATGDFVIPPSEVLKTAKTLGSPYKVYDGLSHNFHIENAWPNIADDMLHWIKQLKH